MIFTILGASIFMSFICNFGNRLDRFFIAIFSIFGAIFDRIFQNWSIFGILVNFWSNFSFLAQFLIEFFKVGQLSEFWSIFGRIFDF